MALLLISKLGQYPIILCHLWIKKYEVLLDIINNFIIFLLKYYIHYDTSLFFILLKAKRIKTNLEIKHKDKVLNYILIRRLDKNIYSFLRII